MVKAEDLIREQKERENRKVITFDKVYELVEKKINLASKANYYNTWYQIPELILGLPLYSLKECEEYISKKLKKNGFKTTFYKPNLLFISWEP